MQIAQVNISSNNFKCQASIFYGIEIMENTVKFSIFQKTYVLQNKEQGNLILLVTPQNKQHNVFSSDPSLNYKKYVCQKVIGKYDRPMLCGQSSVESFYIPREAFNKQIGFNFFLTDEKTKLSARADFSITILAKYVIPPEIKSIENLTRQEDLEKDGLNFTFQDPNIHWSGPIQTYSVEISTNIENSFFSPLFGDYSSATIKIPIDVIMDAISEYTYNSAGMIRIAVVGPYGETGPWTYSEPFIMPAKDVSAKEDKTALSITDADNPYAYLEFDEIHNCFFQVQYGINPTSADDYYGTNHSRQKYFESNGESFIYSNIKTESELLEKLKNFDSNTNIVIRYRILNKDKRLAQKWHYQKISAENIKTFPQFFIRIEDNQSIKAIYLREE